MAEERNIKRDAASLQRIIQDGADYLWGPSGGITLDVEVHEGKVIAVWFGCLKLPFKMHTADKRRADDMSKDGMSYKIHGIGIKKE